MSEKEYLAQKDVKKFINWITNKLDNNFEHSYFDRKTKIKWECNSIYNSYEKYKWQNASFAKNQIKMNVFKNKLRTAYNSENIQDFSEVCKEILNWGQINNNYFNNTNSEILNLFKKAQNYFQSFQLESNYFKNEIILNAGFSKIYSLLFEDFIIFDSRVSAAICFFIKKYLIEEKANIIPVSLEFQYTEGRAGKRRNPNELNSEIVFKKIRTYKQIDNCRVKTYIDYQINNIKANWLLKKILKNSESKFNLIDSENRLRALEAAFFMIGYQIN